MLYHLALCGLLLASSQTHENTPENRWNFHGFAFGSFAAEDDQNPDTRLGHLWLIGSGEIIRDKFSILVILTPHGPPRLLHSLWFTWKEPTGWLDAVRFGRHIPNFTYEFWRYRIDQAPTVGFSAVVDSTSAARANGVEVEGHVGKLQVVGSIFGPSRIGGNIQTHEDTPDLYLRLRCPLLEHLTAGTSYRSASRDAHGLDVLWQKGRNTLVGEYVGGEQPSEWYVLHQVRLDGKVSLVSRFEHLENDERRLATGPTINVLQDVELKMNGLFSNEKPDKVLVQLTARW